MRYSAAAKSQLVLCCENKKSVFKALVKHISGFLCFEPYAYHKTKSVNAFNFVYFCKLFSEIFALLRTSSRNSGFVTLSRTAFPPAQEIGFPPNVEPCVPLPSTSLHFLLARHTPIGTPPARPFASVVMSGFTL